MSKVILFLNNFKRKNNSSAFVPEIDGLRFLAITTVLLYHLNTAFSMELGMGLSNTLILLGGTQTKLSLGWWWIRLDLGVKVFFAISGFVLALPFLRYYLGFSNHKIDLKSYFIRRLTRLEPPFIVSLVFFYFVHVFLLNADAWVLLKSLGVGLIYGHVFLFGESNPINPVTWSLETEAQFYVLLPAIICVFFNRKSTFFSSFGLLILIVLSILFRHEFAFSAHWGRSIFAYFSNFAVGIVLCWLFLKYFEWFNTRNWLYDILGLLATLGLFCFYKPQHEIINQIFFNLSIAFVILTAFKGVFFNWIYTRPIVYIVGGMCYSIYLIHYAFLHLSLKFTKYLVVDTWSYSQNLVVQIIVNGILVLAVSCVFFALIEKPTMDKNWYYRLMKRLKSRLK